MQPYYTHGSSRIMTPERRTKLCELIAQSHTIEEASEAIGVSIRTVQRERKRDEDFDHEVRLALQQTPDPLKLMEQAARTHWRAAAWLLERQNPEEYARKPVNVTTAKKVAAALRFVQETALEAAPEACREAIYKHVQAAIDEAFRHCFPTMGKWGAPKFPKLPVDTPLADLQAWKEREAGVGILRDEPGDVLLPSPVGRVELAEREAEAAARRATAAELKRLLTEELSPKTCEATAVAPPADPLYVTFEQEAAAFEQRRRHRQLRQSNQQLRRALDEAQQRPNVWFPSAEGVPELSEGVQEETAARLSSRRRERQRQRAAAKKAKAARKRAQAQRRRAA
jgi:hypothetical protein